MAHARLGVNPAPPPTHLGTAALDKAPACLCHALALSPACQLSPQSQTLPLPLLCLPNSIIRSSLYSLLLHARHTAYKARFKVLRDSGLVLSCWASSPAKHTHSDDTVSAGDAVARPCLHPLSSLLSLLRPLLLPPFLPVLCLPTNHLPVLINSPEHQIRISRNQNPFSTPA